MKDFSISNKQFTRVEPLSAVSSPGFNVDLYVFPNSR